MEIIENIINTITGEYPLSTELLSKGLRTVYKITTANSTSVVKIYPDKRSHLSYKKNVALCNAGKREGFTFPALYSAGGDDCVFSVGDSSAIVYPWIEGRSVREQNATKDEIISLASSYAKLLRSLRELSGYNVANGFLFNKQNIAKRIREFDQIIEKSCDEEIKRIIKWKQEALVSISEEKLMGVNDATWLLTHGDYYISQVIFKDNTIIGIVDFDSLEVKPIIWELCRAFYSAIDDSLDQETEYKWLLDYLRAFSSESTLTDSDINCFFACYYQTLVRTLYGFDQINNSFISQDFKNSFMRNYKMARHIQSVENDFVNRLRDDL